MNDDQLNTRVAWLYYLENLTQAEIGERLGLTRARVNRMLSEARDSGLVRISLNSKFADCAQTEQALADAGWPIESRPFRPHLTLARSDGIAVGGLVAGRLASAMAQTSIPCRVERLGLFESVTGGGPARYVPVTVEPLASTRSGARPVYHQTSPDPP